MGLRKTTMPPFHLDAQQNGRLLAHYVARTALAPATRTLHMLEGDDDCRYSAAIVDGVCGLLTEPAFPAKDSQENLVYDFGGAGEGVYYFEHDDSGHYLRVLIAVVRKITTPTTYYTVLTWHPGTRQWCIDAADGFYFVADLKKVAAARFDSDGEHSVPTLVEVADLLHEDTETGR